MKKKELQELRKEGAEAQRKRLNELRRKKAELVGLILGGKEKNVRAVRNIRVEIAQVLTILSEGEK